MFIGSIVGLGLLSRQESDTGNTNTNARQENAQSQAAQQQAIQAAENYSPPADTMCTMALTPAIHDETGAEYTFPSGCIAPGWTAVQQ